MRKTYDRDFKIKVSKDIGDKLITVSEVAREYNISRPIVSRWVSEYKRYGKKAFSGNGKRLPNNEKIYILEKENKCLKEDLEILKKFDIFVKQKNR